MGLNSRIRSAKKGDTRGFRNCHVEREPEDSEKKQGGPGPGRMGLHAWLIDLSGNRFNLQPHIPLASCSNASASTSGFLLDKGRASRDKRGSPLAKS